MSEVRAPCEIDFALGTHSTDVDAADWDVDCVKRSASGNSGGVYFVQTAKNVVAVKPGFMVALQRLLRHRLIFIIDISLCFSIESF